MTPATRSRRLGRVRYRIGQGLGYLFEQATPEVESELTSLLTPPQRELLSGLPARDRAHHLEVYHRLRARGCDDPDLLLAALLHDCGKWDERGRAGVSQRTMLVLAGSRFRGLLRQLGSKTGSGWRHGLYLAIEHPSIGAARARAAGCSECARWLIARHHDPNGDGDDGLRLLQEADDEG